MNDVKELFDPKLVCTPIITEGESAEGDKITLIIQTYVDMVEKDQYNMIQKTIKNMIIAHIPPCVRRQDKMTTTSTDTVTNKHSDEQYKILEQLMNKFQYRTFHNLFGTILNDENETNEKKSKANALLLRKISHLFSKNVTGKVKTSSRIGSRVWIHNKKINYCLMSHM
jgi:hypothetical protein